MSKTLEFATRFDEEFRHSVYFERMQEMESRFIHHDPSRQVGSERYIEILGADVDQTRHMRRTLILTSSFIRQHNQLCQGDNTLIPIDDEDVVLLELAAITHDWGESICGDPKFELRTEDDTKKEIVAYEEIFNSLFKNDIDLFEQIGIEREELRSKLVEIIFNSDSSLGKVFNTIERIGYLLTVSRAHRKLTEEDTLTDIEVSQMRRLRREVSGRHIGVLLQRGDEGLPVGADVAHKVGLEIQEAA